MVRILQRSATLMKDLHLTSTYIGEEVSYLDVKRALRAKKRLRKTAATPYYGKPEKDSYTLGFADDKTHAFRKKWRTHHNNTLEMLTSYFAHLTVRPVAPSVGVTWLELLIDF